VLLASSILFPFPLPLSPLSLLFLALLLLLQLLVAAFGFTATCGWSLSLTKSGEKDDLSVVGVRIFVIDSCSQRVGVKSIAVEGGNWR